MVDWCRVCDGDGSVACLSCSSSEEEDRMLGLGHGGYNSQPRLRVAEALTDVLT